MQHRKPVIDNPESDVKTKLRHFKRALAVRLQSKSELLSPQSKKYSLIFFCLLFGGISTLILIHSVSEKQRISFEMKLSKPAHSLQNDKSYLKADSVITKDEFIKVEHFKNYLYQLKADSLNSKKFDSIIQARPHLIDSINLFEKIYLQQK
jgi:hypothetical protein